MLETYLLYTFLLTFMVVYSSPRISIYNLNERSYSYRYWNKKIIFVIFFYTVIIGTRYNVGIDYTVYHTWYEELFQTGRFPENENKEIGFLTLNKILYYFDAHYSLLFITIALFQITFLFKSIKKFESIISWYCFFFFTSLLFFSSLNIMRQTLAYFIFFYALNLLFEKKLGYALAYYTLGLLFHKSILIGLFFIPFIYYEWFKNRFFQVGLLIFVSLLSSTILPILLSQLTPLSYLFGYEYYIENIDYMYEITEENSVGAGLGKYLFFFIDLSIIIFYDQLKERFNSFDFTKYYNLYFLGALFERIAYDNFILLRTNDYLLNFRVLILSFLCAYLFCRPYKILNISLGIIIVVSMLAYFYRGIYISAGRCSPFQFFFMK